MLLKKEGERKDRKFVKLLRHHSSPVLTRQGTIFQRLRYRLGLCRVETDVATLLGKGLFPLQE